MAKIKTREWDIVEHLKTKKDMEAYLEAVLEDGDPGLVAAALGDMARARGGISKIAWETGLDQESLYKVLSPKGDPEFSTVLKVVRAIGLRLKAVELEPQKSASGVAESPDSSRTKAEKCSNFGFHE